MKTVDTNEHSQRRHKGGETDDKEEEYTVLQDATENSEEENDDKDEEQQQQQQQQHTNGMNGKQDDVVENHEDYEPADQEEEQEESTREKMATTKSKIKVHKLSLTQTEDFNAKLKRRGVIYVARIPPRMTPTKMKRLLQEELITTPHGGGNNSKQQPKPQEKPVEITRIYLVEEDASIRKRRRKEHGGNGSKRYVEGWIEFASKHMAKQVALALNNTPISNYKRNAHYGDLWNLKYLKKFQWSHLTEKVAYERRVQEQKLRLETLQARKETAAYKQLVETGQKLDKIEQRLQRKRQRRQEQQVGTSNKADDDDDDKDITRPTKKKMTTRDNNRNNNKSSYKAKQVRPMQDGAEKAMHTSLLSSLV